MRHRVIDVNDVVVRFAGDSGDGMQLTGSLFANTSAIYGNELSTFPDYPAEIRAPHDTVSGNQIPLRHSYASKAGSRHFHRRVPQQHGGINDASARDH